MTESELLAMLALILTPTVLVLLLSLSMANRAASARRTSADTERRRIQSHQ